MRVALLAAVVASQCLQLSAGAAEIWRSAPVGAVQLGGVLGSRVRQVATNNLLRVDLERTFFREFREKKSAGGFLGLGKFADAAVRYAKFSGDERLLALKREVIAALVDSQLEDGYIGYLRPEKRVTALWDLHEIGFIIQALVADYRCFGERRSLEAARKAADYVLANWQRFPSRTEIVERLYLIGLGQGMIDLGQVTGDRRYIGFALRERGIADWAEPPVLRRGGRVDGHAYAYLSECVEQLTLSELGEAEVKCESALLACRHMLDGDGLVIDGAGGIAECWTDDQNCEGEVGESCSVVYQLLLCDKLLKLGLADTARIGELMERLIYNAVPAATSNDGRKIRYYTPLNGKRRFWESDAYCCPNNYRRVMSRLPEFVYYIKDGAVLVNLVCASEAELGLGGRKIKLRCESDFPTGERAVYTVDPGEAAEFEMVFRIPGWCTGATVSVNGAEWQRETFPGGFARVCRTWQIGDRIELTLPETLRCVRGRRRQYGRFAVMRGPVVYALDTTKIAGLKGMHPLDAVEELLIEPSKLEWKEGEVVTRCATAAGATEVPQNGQEIKLAEFADEHNTLTYFRIPCGADEFLVDDSLFVRKGK